MNLSASSVPRLLFVAFVTFVAFVLAPQARDSELIPRRYD